jgi:hypothetical protein
LVVEVVLVSTTWHGGCRIALDGPELGVDHGRRRKRIERLSEIVHDEVATRFHRQLDVRVPEDALDVLDGNARAEEQRRGRVPESVELHLPRDRARPEPNVARWAATLDAVGVAPTSGP